MEWSFRWIVDVTHFLPLALFGEQFHRGLKAIDIQAQRPVEFGELPIGIFAGQAIVAYHLAHNRPILLLQNTGRFSGTGVPA